MRVQSRRKWEKSKKMKGDEVEVEEEIIRDTQRINENTEWENISPPPSLSLSPLSLSLSLSLSLLFRMVI